MANELLTFSRIKDSIVYLLADTRKGKDNTLKLEQILEYATCYAEHHGVSTQETFEFFVTSLSAASRDASLAPEIEVVREKLINADKPRFT